MVPAGHRLRVGLALTEALYRSVRCASLTLGCEERGYAASARDSREGAAADIGMVQTKVLTTERICYRL